MDPLFALPLAPAPIYGRSTNFEYKKTLPDTVFNRQAPAQRHVFRWQNQAAEWWIPEQSYLRIRWKLGKFLPGTSQMLPLAMSDGVAPIMNFCPALFSRIEYYMDGNKLSDLQDYIPQIDTMARRTRESKAFQSSISDRQAFMSPDFIDRQRLVCIPQASQDASDSILLLSDSKRQSSNQGAWFNRVANEPPPLPYIVSRGDIGYVAFIDPKTPLTFAELKTLNEAVMTINPLLACVDEKTDIFMPLPFDNLDCENSYLKIGPNNLRKADRSLAVPHGTYKITGVARGARDGKAKMLIISFENSISVTNVAHHEDEGEGEGEDDDHAGDIFKDNKTAQFYWFPLTADGAPNSAAYAAYKAQYDVGGGAGEVNHATVLTELKKPESHTHLTFRLEILRFGASSKVKGSSRQETLWVPPLGIFRIGHAIPTTRHELHLVIPNDYMKRALEFGALGYGDVNSVGELIHPAGATVTPDDGKTRFRLEIESIEFFAAMVSGPRADDAKFVLDLSELRMSPLTLTPETVTTSQTYPFNLSPNSSKIAVAFQSGAAGNGIMSLTKFHLPTNQGLSGGELALNRFYVNFAGQNRPREENESELATTLPFPSAFNELENSKQFFSQRYLETMWNSGLINTQGGCETFEEWLARGAFYHWNWPRDGGDLSTRFHVFLAMHNGDVSTDMKGSIVHNGYSRDINGQPNNVVVLVFDVVSRPYLISIRNGNVVSAETSEATIPDGARRIRL